nr:MAG TPA: hypothetical protein [Caudoviricetes sp.]
MHLMLDFLSGSIFKFFYLKIYRHMLYWIQYKLLEGGE